MPLCSLQETVQTTDSGPERGQAKLPLSYSSVLTCQTDVSQTVITFVTNTPHSSLLTSPWSIGVLWTLECCSYIPPMINAFVSACNILLMFSDNLSLEIY